MKKTILTGVKSTGSVHVGRYLGAMKPAIELSLNPDYQALYFVADYHALTTLTDGKLNKTLTYEVAASWISIGLDPEKVILYRQSDIPEIFELSWLLSCVTPKGLMNRAHAYKAIVADNQTHQRKDEDHGVNIGLYTYPVLMSADILAFDVDVVPVGEDQLQHLEIARDTAQRFNRVFGDCLKVPNVIIQKNLAVVPGIDGRKMSASYDNTIPIFSSSKKLRKIIMKIKTDSSPPEAPKNQNDNSLFFLYSQFALPEQIEEMAKNYQNGIAWGEVKQCLFEVMDSYFNNPREIFNDLMADTQRLDQILSDGAQKARQIAMGVLSRVRNNVGANLNSV